VVLPQALSGWRHGQFPTHERHRTVTHNFDTLTGFDLLVALGDLIEQVGVGRVLLVVLGVCRHWVLRSVWGVWVIRGRRHSVVFGLSRGVCSQSARRECDVINGIFMPR